MNPRREGLSQATLSAELSALGYRVVELVEVTGSTSTDLVRRVERERGRGGAVDMTIRIAEEQTAGRGRLGRTWTAPPRSTLAFSVLLDLPEVPASNLGLLPLLAALSVAEASNRILEAAGGAAVAQVKWPNDVEVRGAGGPGGAGEDARQAADGAEVAVPAARKLAGILVDVVSLDPHPVVVLGVGLNVDLREPELPVPHATSLALELHRGGQATPPTEDVIGGRPEAPAPLRRQDVLVSVAAELATELSRWRALGGAAQAFLPRYRRASSTIGREVTVALPGGEVLTGVAEGVGEAGELLVREPATGTSPSGRVPVGRVRSLRSGEVTHVRARAQASSPPRVSGRRTNPGGAG